MNERLSFLRRGYYWDALSQRPDSSFKATVCCASLDLTEDRLIALWGMSRHPLIAVGEFPIGWIVDLALSLLEDGLTLRFVRFPADPAILAVQEPDGPQALRKALDGSLSLIGALWREVTRGRPTGSLRDLRAIRDEMDEAVAIIPDPKARAKYAKLVREKVAELRQPPVKERANPGMIRLTKGPEEEGMSLREAAILAEIVQDPGRCDPEKIVKANGFSLSFDNILSEIFTVIGSSPGQEKAALQGSPTATAAITEAFTVLHAAGVTSFDG